MYLKLPAYFDIITLNLSVLAVPVVQGLRILNTELSTAWNKYSLISERIVRRGLSDGNTQHSQDIRSTVT